MNRFGTLAYYMLLSVAAVPAGSAQGLSVDWKFYGGASIQGKSQFCLKLRALLKRLTVTYEFGQKCLPQTVLDNIDTKTELGDRIVQDTAQKRVDYHMPPVAKIETLNFDQIMQTIQYEQTANIGDIAPWARIFYELNCSEPMMLRELSIFIQDDFKSGSRNKPSGSIRHQRRPASGC